MVSARDVVDRWSEFNEQGRRKHHRDHLSANGNIRFEGPLLYSYRTPIARYWGTFVLVVDGKWSSTTSSHRRQAQQAVNYPVFEVPDIHRTDTPDNFAALSKVFATALGEYRTKYLHTQETGWKYTYMRQEVLDTFHTLKKYQRTTKCAGDLPDFDALIAEADQHRQAKLDHYNSPAEVAKRERKAARREALQAMDLPEAKETD